MARDAHWRSRGDVPGPQQWFESLVDLLKDQLTEGMVPEVKGDHEAWMQDTYLDNGVLVRHGT